MKIKYKNFIIEEDTSCFILSEIGIKEKGDNIGEEYIKDQVYPSTFENAILGILKRIKATKKEELKLKEYIEEINKINNDFLINLKQII